MNDGRSLRKLPMSRRPDITDDGVFNRWMRLEIGKINDGIVAVRKTLQELLAADRPVSTTKGGKEYLFDAGVLRRLGEALPEECRWKLRLPILFYFDAHVKDSCYLADEVAVRALQHLGELSTMREMHERRLWVGRAIAFSLIGKYPTAVQIVMA
jgi:uncharacterized protein (UPF0216 family)